MPADNPEEREDREAADVADFGDHVEDVLSQAMNRGRDGFVRERSIRPWGNRHRWLTPTEMLWRGEEAGNTLPAYRDPGRRRLCRSLPPLPNILGTDAKIGKADRSCQMMSGAMDHTTGRRLTHQPEAYARIVTYFLAYVLG